jgi:hypothetical protein
MAIYPNPFVLNIIDLQNVITNSGGTNTSNLIAKDIESLKTMVNTTTRTVYTDYLKDFSGTGSIQVGADLNFTTNTRTGNTSGIYSNGTSVSMGSGLAIASQLSSGSTVLSISTSGSLFSVTNGRSTLFGIDSTGTGTFSGGVYGTGFYTLSDILAKRDITAIENSYERVCSLQPSSWTWADTEKKGIGLLAQDVERVFPELIEEGGGAGKHINLTGLLAHMVGSIQTLSTLVSGVSGASETSG